MIDIHSHILPEIDDGAKDIKESIELLEELNKQGVNHVFLTPHFYPMETTLEDFLLIRKNCFDKLTGKSHQKGLPKIYLGAEVFYFRGIGKSQDIKKLRLENTDYLLLELSNSNIDQCVLADIREIKENLGLTPIIAHIERYSKEKGFRNLLNLIKEGICLAQVNTESLVYKPYNKKTKKLIKKGYISFIASDAHSVSERPPMFTEALKIIDESKLSEEYSILARKSSELIDEINNNEK